MYTASVRSSPSRQRSWRFENERDGRMPRRGVNDGEDFCRTNLGQYAHRERVKRDVIATLKNFQDLKVDRGKFYEANGQSRDLVKLHGTLPVIYKGSSYNIPVCLWLEHHHPDHAPICIVEPTATMQVRSGRHVDANGRVYLPYLHEWRHPNSDILGLIQVMQLHFGEECPVFSRPAGGSQPPPRPAEPPRRPSQPYPTHQPSPTSSQPPYPGAGYGGGPAYSHQPAPPPVGGYNSMPTPAPSYGGAHGPQPPYPAPGGSYPSQPYPGSHPAPYPGASTGSQPYPHGAPYPGGAPPPRPAHPGYPSGNQPYPTPPPGGSMAPYPTGGARYPAGPQPPYPGTSSSSSTPYPGGTCGPSDPFTTYPPPRDVTPSTGGPALSSSHNGSSIMSTTPAGYGVSAGAMVTEQARGNNDDDEASENWRRKSLVSGVEDKLKRRLKDTLDAAEVEVNDLQMQQHQLQLGSEKLDSIFTELQRLQTEAESNIAVMTTKSAELQEVLEKLDQSSGSRVDIDEAVVTTYPLYNQIVNMIAEDNAIEDTVYYLGEALRKKVIALDVFLKYVRDLSTRQYVLRATLQKAQLVAQL